MKWIKVKDQKPPEEPILFFCTNCQMTHVAIYDYDEHGHLEHCTLDEDDGKRRMFIGDGVEFEYWAELPKGPNQGE